MKSYTIPISGHASELVFHLTLAHIPQKAITLCQLSNLLLWCWWRMEWIRLSGPKGKQYTLPNTPPWSVLVLIQAWQIQW